MKCTRRCTGTATARCCSRPRTAGASTCGASTLGRASRGASCARRLGARLRHAPPARSSRVADAADHPARVHARRAGRAAAAHRVASTTSCSPASRSAGTKRSGSRARNGDDVQMWLFYPPGFDAEASQASAAARHPRRPAHRRPATTGTTAGTTRCSRRRAMSSPASTTTARRASATRSRTRSRTAGAQLEQADIEAATDWLLEAAVGRPQARVFAGGGSYGGYMVAWLNGHVTPGRYTAYVCHAGCFDWVGMFADDAYTWHAEGARRRVLGRHGARCTRRARMPSPARCRRRRW